MWKLPKGDDFLPGVSIQELRRLYKVEKKAKPKMPVVKGRWKKMAIEPSPIIKLRRRSASAILPSTSATASGASGYFSFFMAYPSMPKIKTHQTSNMKFRMA